MLKCPVVSLRHFVLLKVLDLFLLYFAIIFSRFMWSFMIEIAPGRINFRSLRKKHRVSNFFHFCLVFYLLNIPPAVVVIKNDISYKMISLYSHFSTNLLEIFFLDTGFKI